MTDIQATVGLVQLREALWDLGRGTAQAATLGLVVNALYLLVPLYMLQIYDRVVPSHSVDTLIFLTMMTAGGLLIFGVLDFLRGRLLAISGERLARRLGGAVLGASVHASLTGQSADAAAAVRDLQEIRQFVTGGPVALPCDMMMAPLFLVVLFLLHPAYGLLGLGAITLLVALGIGLEWLSRSVTRGANEAASRSQAEIGSVLRQAELIEAMGMLGAVVQRWQRGQQHALAMVARGNDIGRAAAATARVVRMAIQVTVLATGVMLVIDQAISAGTIVAGAIVIGRLLLPFEQIIDGWKQWASCLAALRRLRHVLALAPKRRSTMPVSASPGQMVLERVTFMPPASDRLVLKSVSFTVAAGEIVGVIGPSGAGKSTLARLLVGVWQPTTGGIFFDGQDVATWERESFGSFVGYLPQNAPLLEGTVAENISRYRDADPAEIIAAARAAGVHEMIGRLPRGYATRLDDTAMMLSGGQRQRLALARALFGDPRLLVLDEPNAFLDHEGEQALARSLSQARERGATIVLIAQRLSILKIAQRIVLMRDGQVDQIGPREEILRLGSRPGLRSSPDEERAATGLRLVGTTVR